MANQLLDRIDPGQVVEVCQALVRLKTINPPGDETIAAQYVADYLRPYGFESELVTHEPGRASVIARLKGKGGAAPLAFNGHLDVVPVGAGQWAYPPFEAEVADGKVWGRGTADMKGGLAAMLVAARALAQAGQPLRGDLIIAATAGEEVNMLGACVLAEHPALAGLQAILISEPTLNQVGLAERGVFWPEFHTYGKTAHGSTPELGRNAIWMMIELLAEVNRLDIPFQRHPLLGDFTRSINTIQGGVKTNVVPDHCVATVDMRTVPGQDNQALLRLMQETIDRLSQRIPGFQATVQSAHDLAPAETNPQEPVVRRFNEIVAEATGQPAQPALVKFATEAAVFVPRLGTPSIIYGPGDPALAHQPDEFVEIERMVQAARVYLLAAAQLLS